MIYFFGDVHLSSMNIWNAKVSEKFVNWFKDTFKNENKENYIIWLGDLIDKSISPGNITDLLFKLFEFCNGHFKKTYALMGNHDIKMYRDFSIQSGIKFINNFNDVEVIEDIKLLNIEDKNILCLPFKVLDNGESINTYYSNFDWSKTDYKKENIDLAIGHWTIQDKNDIRFRDGVDVSNIPAKRILCGHIHNRPDQRYIGSVYPLNAEEMKCKYPRCYITWDLNNKWTENKLPDFLVFETIEYGETLSEDNNVIKVYTVSDAPSETDALIKYDGFIIKGVTKLKKPKDISVDTNNSSLINKNNLELFDEMIKEQNIQVTRSAYKVIKELLSKN